MGAGPLEEVLEHGPLFDELEDEAWWSGVDLVDTATHLFQIEEHQDYYCGTGGEEDCSSVPLHQDHLRLPPPPPVPPALSELVKQLHLLAPSSSSSESSTGCLLCQWASLNGTSMDDLIPNPGTVNNTFSYILYLKGGGRRQYLLAGSPPVAEA